MRFSGLDSVDATGASEGAKVGWHAGPFFLVPGAKENNGTMGEEDSRLVSSDGKNGLV